MARALMDNIALSKAVFRLSDKLCALVELVTVSAGTSDRSTNKRRTAEETVPVSDLVEQRRVGESVSSLSQTITVDDLVNRLAASKEVNTQKKEDINDNTEGPIKIHEIIYK